MGMDENAFISAVKSGDYHKMALYAHSVDVSTLNKALIYNNSIQGAEILINAGADVNCLVENHDYPTNALHTAFEAGNLELAKYLILRGADVNGCALWNGETLIHQCEDLSFTAFLIEHGANVNCRSNVTFQTPLHTVCSVEILELLLRHGADANLRDEDGKTPLFYANVEEASLLLDHGAALQVTDDLGESVLFRANSAELAIFYMNAGIDLSILNAEGKTALESLAEFKYKASEWKQIVYKWIEKGGRCKFKCFSLLFGCSDVTTARYLLDCGADPLARNSRGETVLFDVADIELCEYYIHLGVDVNALDNLGRNALFTCKHKAIASMLIEHGCNPKQRAYNGETPIFRHWTCDHEDEDALFEYLLDHVDLEAVNAEGQTALLYFTRDHKRLLALLKRGAYIHAKDCRGNTALHLCRRSVVAKALIEAGAEIDRKNHLGQTPLHTCYHPESVDNGIFIAEFYAESVAVELIACGANVNAIDNLRQTPLHRCKDAHCVELFVCKGADVNAQDCNGNTPLHLCSSVDVCRALLRCGADYKRINHRGETPLSLCTKPDILRTLWEAGARTFGDEGESSFAVCSNSVELFRAYCALGGHITKDTVTAHSRLDGNTPLHLAVMRDDFDMVKLLINYGADALAVNHIGFTPLNYINYTHNGEKIAELLMSCGASKLDDASGVLALTERTTFYQTHCMTYCQSKCEVLNNIMDIHSVWASLNRNRNAQVNIKSRVRAIRSKLNYANNLNVYEILFIDSNCIVGCVSYSIENDIEQFMQNKNYFEHYYDETKAKLIQTIDGSFAYIHNVYIRPEKRHAGYFAEMMCYVLDVLKDNSILLLRAETALKPRRETQGRLIELYQKSGFEVIQHYGLTALMQIKR